MTFASQQRERAQASGHELSELPRLYARLINESLATASQNMVTGIHLCRGNFRSSWAAEGGYEPVVRNRRRR